MLSTGYLFSVRLFCMCAKINHHVCDYSVLQGAHPISYALGDHVLTEKLLELEREYGSLENDLGNPAIFSDQSNYLRLNRRYGELSPIVKLWREYQACQNQLAQAQELRHDPEMSELAELEIEEHLSRIKGIEQELDVLLMPKDPRDQKNVILEIRSGAGGDEAGLFAADLFRMYSRYAEIKGLRIEVLDSNLSDLGGFSKLTAEVSGDAPYRAFKYEMGVHRVQRVPATESQGRIHTSTVTVAVLPEAEESDLELDMSQIRTDVYRSQGAGGQGVNTTDSAVRLVYKAGTPDELIVICQDGRSQIKNREKALVVLRSRLLEMQRAEEDAARSAERAAMIGTGDRSEKIRTYNYPQNRVTDHRLVGDVKNFPLDTVIEGRMDGLLEGLQAWERESLLESMADHDQT